MSASDTAPDPEPAAPPAASPEPAAPPVTAQSVEDALLREYGQLTLEVREHQAQARIKNRRLEQIKDRVTDIFERRQMQSVNLIGVGNIHLKRTGWAKLKGGTDDSGKYTQEQRDAAAAALKAAGLQDLVKPGFSLQSVSARYREWREQGEHPPPELAQAFEFETDYDIGVKAAPGRSTT